VSEFHFGVSREKPSRHGAALMERVAKKHGACLVEVTLPGTGYQRWFAVRNLGFPLDREFAAIVIDELRVIGVLTADTDKLADKYRAQEKP
jgi:hypothetical protein